MPTPPEVPLFRLYAEQRRCHDTRGHYEEYAEQHVAAPFRAGAVRVDIYVGHYGRTFTGTGFAAEPRLRRSATYKAVNGMTRVPISAQSATA